MRGRQAAQELSVQLSTMKRTRMDSVTLEDASDSPVPSKRAKSVQACSSCRRSKTRCELLDAASASGSLKCHRCKVLNLSCSFEKLPPPPPLYSRPTPPTSRLSPPPRFFQSPAESSSSATTAVADICSAVKNPSDDLEQPDAPWALLRTIDFDDKAIPMLALQEFVTRPHTGAGDCRNVHYRGGSNPSMAGILTQDEASYLIDMYVLKLLDDNVFIALHRFNTRYSPWLSLQPDQDFDTPLLNLARCSVASRHLDSATRPAASQALQKLAEDSILSQIFSPSPSTDAVHALLILSLWSPVCCTPTPVRDGRLLVGSAVSMAMNLRLGQASTYARSLMELKEGDVGPSGEKLGDLEEAMEKSRLVCLFRHLQRLRN
jgi:hypothetical protein